MAAQVTINRLHDTRWRWKIGFVTAYYGINVKTTQPNLIPYAIGS